MTVPSDVNKSGPYFGNGVTTAFNYDFKVVDETHLSVVVRDTVSGVQRTLVLNSDYTVTGVGNSGGGQIITTTAPTSSETLTILRNIPFTQDVDLENQGAYYAETVESALDLMVMRDQQLAEELERSIKLPADADPSLLPIMTEGLHRLYRSVDAIDTVAASVDDVETVAANIADVNALGPVASDIADVASIKSDVTTVASIKDDVTTVASIKDDVLAVPGLVQDAQDARDDAVDAKNAAQAARDIAAGYASDAVSQGNVPIYATVSGMSSLEVPAGINVIRVNGWNDPGDGEGGKFCDYDTGNGVAFTSGGTTARDWYYANDSIGAAVWSSGVYRTMKERARDVCHIADFNIDLTGNNDDTSAVQEWLNQASEPGIAQAKRGIVLVSSTLIIPKGVKLRGSDRYDRWSFDDSVGTIFKTVGPGNAARWTDIDGSDPADDTPLFVAGGNGVYLEDVTLLTEDGENAWSIGIFYPCVKQCGFQRLSAFNFTDGCIYLDLTWSDRNTTLKALHPEIESSTGMNEFAGDDFWAISGPDGCALKIQGTTRPGDIVGSESEWLWGWGGGSDIRFTKGRLSGRGANGSCFSHDAQLFGVDKFAQGTTIRDTAFRGINTGYCIKADRTNRLIIDGCVAENGTEPVRIGITSRTQKNISGIIRVNDDIGGITLVDGVQVGSGQLQPWSTNRNITTFKTGGHISSPVLEGSSAGSAAVRTILRYFKPNSSIQFHSDDGTSSTPFLNFFDTMMTPTVENYDLGSFEAPFGILRTNEVRAFSLVRPQADNTVGLGTGSFRWTQVYAASGTINTSDEATKQQIGKIPDEWLDAWGDVDWCRYKLNDAVALKGDGARWHTGLVAQRVRDAFAARGIDAFAIGLLCYDEWGDQYEDEYDWVDVVETDEDGNEVVTKDFRPTGRKVLVKPGGSIYGIRYEEALSMEAAWQRREIERMKESLIQAVQELSERVAELEGKGE